MYLSIRARFSFSYDLTIRHWNPSCFIFMIRQYTACRSVGGLLHFLYDLMIAVGGLLLFHNITSHFISSSDPTTHMLSQHRSPFEFYDAMTKQLSQHHESLFLNAWSQNKEDLVRSWTAFTLLYDAMENYKKLLSTHKDPIYLALQSHDDPFDFLYVVTWATAYFPFAMLQWPSITTS